MPGGPIASTTSSRSPWRSNYQASYDSFPPGTMGDHALPPDRRVGWTVILFHFATQGLRLIIDLMQA